MNSQLTILLAASQQSDRIAAADRSRRAAEAAAPRSAKDRTRRTRRILRRRPVAA